MGQPTWVQSEILVMRFHRADKVPKLYRKKQSDKKNENLVIMFLFQSYLGQNGEKTKMT